METIHVKFDELTAMASEHKFLEPETNRFNDDKSSADFTSIPSKEDLDNLFSPMYEEYFEKRSPKVSINSAAQTTHNNQDTPSSSSIIVKDNEALPLLSSSEEQISPISHNEADKLVQEDDPADLDRNTMLSPYHTPMYEEAESSSTAEDPSNMHEITLVQPSTHTWTKAHPLKQVIGDPCRPVMTRSRLNTDAKVSKGYKQEEGVNLKELFAPVARLEAVRMCMVSSKLQEHGNSYRSNEISEHDRRAHVSHREKLVSLSSKKHDCTALSTAKADAISISCNLVQHSYTKHINIRYPFIKEPVKRGTVELYFVGTEYQLADLFTKALPKECYEYLVHRIGRALVNRSVSMRCMTLTELELLAKLPS
ncbi:hypothetical protein Tco_0555489 [Tanacetum coccineum]